MNAKEAREKALNIRATANETEEFKSIMLKIEEASGNGALSVVIDFDECPWGELTLFQLDTRGYRYNVWTDNHGDKSMKLTW